MPHSILPPSSAYRWGVCSASVLAQAGRPDPETPASREGDAGHWVMAEVLLAYTGRRDSPLVCEAYIGRAAPNGVVIDEKIAQGADVIVADVLKVCQAHGALQSLRVEQPVSISRVHPACWGTPDVSLHLPASGWLFVWDYKSGHDPVVAVENEQLALYVAGLLDVHGIDGYMEQQTNVCARIIQPFSYDGRGPVREWVFAASDLRGQLNHLSAQAHEALGGSPRMVPGGHCTYCLAVKDCAGAKRYGYRLIDAVNIPLELDDMAGADLAAEREILRDGLMVMTARLEAVEEDLRHRVTQGDGSTGFALETTPGRLEFTVEAPVAVSFAAQFGVDISKPGVITPTQAIEKAPADIRPMFKEALKSITRRPAGALKLVPAAESRTLRAFQTKP